MTVKKFLCAIFIFSVVLLCPAAAARPATAAAATVPAPVEISDRAGLEAVADNPGGGYVLTADIDLSDSPWTPIPFSGKFDGNGHTIYNITINELEREDPIIAHNANDRNHWYANFAGFFSRLEGAEVRNLNLLGADVRIECEKDAFAGMLAGYSQDSEITGCSADGRVYLESNKILLGVGGILGYGNADVTGCRVDAELIFMTSWREFPYFCEEYLGGVVGNGSGNIRDNKVRVRGYATIHGFAHNGGIAGLYRDHDAKRRARNTYVIENNEIDAEIHFFEHTRGRHAFCALIWGERAGANVDVRNNTEINFLRDESFDYNVRLLPEKCASPVYRDTFVAPEQDSFGYTEHVCAGCGYTFRDGYVSPQDYFVSESDELDEPDEPDPNQPDDVIDGIFRIFAGLPLPMLIIGGNVIFIMIVVLLSVVLSKKRDY